MPELPDVEKHRRMVAERATGAKVRRVEVRDRQLLEGTSPQDWGDPWPAVWSVSREGTANGCSCRSVRTGRPWSSTSG